MLCALNDTDFKLKNALLVQSGVKNAQNLLGRLLVSTYVGCII